MDIKASFLCLLLYNDVNVNGQTSLACLPVVELIVPAGVELLEGGLHLLVSQVLADCHKLLQISELVTVPR